MTEQAEGAIAGIGDVIADVSGIEQALINPTETANADLFAVIYAAEGSYEFGATGLTALHTIYVDVLKRRTDLAVDMAALKPFIDLVPGALLAEIGDGGGRFGNTITTFGGVDYKLTYDDYAGTKVIGYRFIMQSVKILGNL